MWCMNGRVDYTDYLRRVLKYKARKIKLEDLTKYTSMEDSDFDNYFGITKWRKKFGLDGRCFTYWRNQAERILTEIIWIKHFYGGKL